MWKKTLALLFSFLILGLAFSGASATASLVNSTVNGTVTVPSELTLEKKPGNKVQPHSGGATVVLKPFVSAFVPGVGWVVAVGSLTLVALIAQYLYSKPVKEFTEGFVSEIPDRITYNGQELAKGVKTNFWGTEVEIGYGYVKKEWGGLKKEAVIVKSVIKINRDEVKAVEDLFSPKDLGRVLAKAYLNGWNAKDAYTIAREFRKATQNFHAEFKGLNMCKAGDVTMDPERREHIIEAHITMEAANWKKLENSQWQVNSGEDVANIIKEVIESFDKSASRCYDNGKTAVLKKNKGGIWYRVVIKKIKGKWKVWTAFPES